MILTIAEFAIIMGINAWVSFWAGRVYGEWLERNKT